MPEGPAIGRVEAKRRALTMPSTAPASSARWWCKLDLAAELAFVLPQNEVRARTDFCGRRRWILAVGSGRANVYAGGAIHPARTGRADSDTWHDQRWRERPRQGSLGSGAGHDGGVVHAIVGAVTSARTPSGESAQNAASLSSTRQVRRFTQLLAVRAHRQPGVRESLESASKPGGQPDAIFAWPPVWPRCHGPSCR